MTTDMMYKKLFLGALTAMAIVACSDDLVESPPVVKPTPQEPQEMPIMFGSMSKGTTRAEYTGAEAAKYLNYQFVVSGYKGAKTAPVGTIVFDNYVVKYKENTAHTTESNTSNWEYVGVDRIQHAIDNGITRQSTKYWDYNVAQYDFIAWSTGTKTAIYDPNATLADGEVYVSTIKPATAFNESGGAFTMKGKAKDLTDCYIADLVTVKKAQYGENPVVIKFRSLGTKVRIGIYETIPGYSVKDVHFYAEADKALPDNPATPRLFTTTANQIFNEGIYTIYYPTVNDESNADNNQAHVRFTGIGDQSTVVEFGNLNCTTREEGEKSKDNVYLGRSSNNASMAGRAEGNYYTQYIPNESGTNLNLRVNYTLESIDGSGETIEVKGATAQVPSIYTQWKAGFAYTYLFKISDKTDGHTGPYDPEHPDDTSYNPDPTGLYPITFDAVVINDEDDDQTQETITLVSTPSITTYQENSKVVDNNEYLASAGDIYVTVSENDNLVDLDGKVALYTIPDGKTEAEVIDALQIPDDYPPANSLKGRNGMVLHKADFTLTNTIKYGVDGNTITVGDKQAAKFEPSADTYAFVYTKTLPDATFEKYEPVTKAANEDVTNLYRNFSLTATTGDAQSGVIYYSKDADGKLTRQIPFIGQDVSNLYIRTGGSGTEEDPYTYAQASGYAVSNTTYYIKNGDNYVEATNVPYAPNITAEANQVILPQQVDGWYIYQYTPADKNACMKGEKALSGHAYYDKYFQNNGVYYSKVIKVQ